MDTSNETISTLLGFIVDLHHEIRSPVNTILNMTELVLREGPNPPVSGYIEAIKKSANALLTILDDIIELSQDGLGHDNDGSVYSISGLLEDIKEAVNGQRLSSKGIDLCLKIEADVPEWFVGAGSCMRQLIMQLLNFSIKRLGSRDIILSVETNGPEKRQKIVFTINAYLSEGQVVEVSEIIKNPRILVCQRLGEDKGHGLDVTQLNGGVGFSFSFDVLRQEVCDYVDKDHIESQPAPVTCIVGRDNFSTAVVARRLESVGFKVFKNSNISQAESVLANHVSPLVKGALLVDWGSCVNPGPLSLAGQLLDRHPVVFFDIPPVDLMDFRGWMNQNGINEEMCGLVMTPSRGNQLLLELGKVLGLDQETIDTLLNLIDLEAAKAREQDMSKAELLEGLKILVVEDDRINQKIVVDTLKRFKARPVVASSGKAVMAAINRHTFDAILMDINLPDTDGYTLTRKIRKLEQYKEVPIIALTASTRNREKCLKAGMDDFLLKPFSELELLDKLTQHIASLPSN